MIGFIFSIISAIFYSLNQIFNKKLLLNKLDNSQTLLISNFFLAIVSFFVNLIFGDYNFPYNNFKFLIIIFLIGFFGFFGIYYLVKSFKYLYVGESLAISNIYPFVNLFLVFIIFGEKITFFQFIIMIIVFIGIVMLIENKNTKIKLNKHYFYPLITAISWGFYGFLIYYLIKKDISEYLILFYGQTIMFIITLIYFSLIKKDKTLYEIKNIFKNKKNLFYASLAGFTTNFGTLFYSLSTNYINPAIASSIGSTQVALTFIFSYFLLKEKINKKQIIAIFIITLSLIGFNLT